MVLLPSRIRAAPEDLDVRRNILRRLKKVLTDKFLKVVGNRFI